ncbi:MAG: LacI family DNA-binding transcriptional regulator [Acidibacillus sp.]|uniref:Ribose operon repressor n=1 Tax=Sulfoacidibacillus ferrooxidans TaxID=2005001 RepID=A0A9X2ADX5_9BACL|nr:LacI family DNA-binding transcriptional regulator [Sulfoacidibacillus ferrooxidans]MCI0182546.1 Ribose operon repressor [Sulfoacidibacillus ferrooxidans]MCY0894182.1 LacI family DNA-binding transcriptional regulator [Acidibacillus sp.]
MTHTIKDVAKLAGVGIATVSRVINQNGYVSPDTAKRVMKAMAELDFTPSPLARGLVSRKTATIGLVIPDVANPFFAEVARGTEDAAIAKGFTVILCNSDWKAEREKMYSKLLRQKWAEGVIAVGSRSSESSLRELIDPLPMVFVDRFTMLPGSDSVWSDNKKGGLLATQHLIDMGCRKLAHISGPTHSPASIARQKGFLLGIKEANVSWEIVKGDFRYRSGYDAGMELLTRDVPPDGIFAGNDLMAVGILQAAASLHIRIPDDLLVIGYDNIAMAEYVAPPLSTVDQPAYEMGRIAFDMLHKKMQDETRESRNVREFEPLLILRESTNRK